MARFTEEQIKDYLESAQELNIKSLELNENSEGIITTEENEFYLLSSKHNEQFESGIQLSKINLSGEAPSPKDFIPHYEIENYLEIENSLDYYKLTDDEYRRLRFKFFEEDLNNFNEKIAHTDDVIKAYFYQESNNHYIEAEIDTRDKTIKADNNTLLIYDKYMNGDVKLLDIELQSVQMLNKIEDQIKELRENYNIIYEPSFFRELINQYDTYDFQNTDGIRQLYGDLQRTNNAIEKINTVLENINDYREEYYRGDAINLNEYAFFGNSYERDTKVDVYFDSWTEMKDLYERQASFQKGMLKVYVEDFLKDMSPVYQEVDLNPDDTRLADYISKTKDEDFSQDRILPLVTSSNENETTEKIRNNMILNNYTEYMGVQFNFMKLYDPNINYENSNLESFINSTTEQATQKIIDLVSNEMKKMYGNDFQLFSKEELEELSTKKLFEKLEPIVQHDTFSLYELQKLEPVTKTEFEIRDFWESKNIEMFMEYSKQVSIPFESDFTSGIYSLSNGMYLESKNIEAVINKIPDLVDNSNELNDKKVEKIKEAIEETKDSLRQIQMRLNVDLKQIRIEPEKEMNPEDRKEYNRNLNNLLIAHNLETKMKQFETYIDLVENTKFVEKENHKEMEMER